MPAADAPHPAYKHVRDDLRRRIEADEWAPGEQLPTVRQLAVHYGVGTTTIDTAVAPLRDEGLIIGRQGKGMYRPRPAGDG